MPDKNAPWLRFYDDIPHHLDYPDATLYAMVKSMAQKYPHAAAYEFMGAETDYAEFDEHILKTAAAFSAMGIKRGDRVTLALPNIPQALWCFYGLNRIGGNAGTETLVFGRIAGLEAATRDACPYQEI